MFELWMQLDTWRPMLATIFGVALFVTAIFLILLVLVQRGRGGGLAGAFGGMGGQSAFGAKAGDTFTKITIYASTFWILLCMAALVLLNPKPAPPPPGPPAVTSPGGAGTGVTADIDEDQPATGEVIEEGSAGDDNAAPDTRGDSGTSDDDLSPVPEDTGEAPPTAPETPAPPAARDAPRDIPPGPSDDNQTPPPADDVP